jgi:hypothetical protein
MQDFYWTKYSVKFLLEMLNLSIIIENRLQNMYNYRRYRWMKNPVAKVALALLLVGGTYGGYKVYEHKQEQQQLNTIKALQNSMLTLYKDTKKEL